MFWNCEVCGAQNHEIDGECQYCECEGPSCKRPNCSNPLHFFSVEDFTKLKEIEASMDSATEHDEMVLADILQDEYNRFYEECLAKEFE